MYRVTTEERIVRAMAEQLRLHGYAATGMKQLATASCAPIGSIYHHFKGGKREIAVAALRQTGAVYIELIPLLLDPFDDLAAGLEAAFATAAEDLEQTGWANMCPVGTVAGEVADVEPELRSAAAEIMTLWVTHGTEYLTRRGLPQESATSLIYAVLAALEGGFTLARAQRSREPLHAAGEAMAAYAVALRGNRGKA